MKFWIKDAKTGEIREATRDEILNLNSVLLNEDGSVARSMPSQTPAGSGDATSKTVDELIDVVKGLAGRVDEFAKTASGVQEQAAAIQEAGRRGFPLGKTPVMGRDGEMTEEAKLFFPYDLSKQGKRLVDKAYYANPIAPEKKQALAEYFILFIKAAYHQDVAAKAEFFRRYHQPLANDVKTALGDPGNVFPVPDILEEEILHFARERSVVLRKATMPPMTSEKLSYPMESSKPTVTWGNTTPQSDPGASEVELTAYELSAFSEVLNTTLADTRSDIVSWLTDLMAEAVGLELDNVAFNGDGTSTYGYCSGLLSSACGYSVVMAEGSTGFSNVDADVFSELISKLDGVKKSGAEFFMSGNILHYVRTLKDTNGNPIFMPGYVGTGVPPTIYGYPYTEVTNMPSTTGANTAFVVFGNLKYFLLGKRLDVMSLQVNPWDRWTTNRTRFKIYNRWAPKIGLANGFSRLLTAAS